MRTVGIEVDPVSPEAKAYHRELGQAAATVQAKYGLDDMGQASHEQLDELDRLVDGIKRRYGVGA